MDEPSDFAEILSVVLIAGLAAAWLALIVRRYRRLGPMAPLHGPRWFADLFKEGLTIIRRSRWLILVPLAAVVIQSCESLLWGLILSIKEPEALERHPTFETKTLLELLSGLWRNIIPEYFRAASGIAGAMLHAFRSPATILLFFLLVMSVLLRPRSDGISDSAAGLGGRTRAWLGIFLGLVGFSFFLIPIWGISFKGGDVPLWAYIPDPLTYLFAWPFAYALMIPSMDSADRGQAVSFAKGLSNVERHFRPLFCFVVIAMGVSLASTLEMYVGLLLPRHHGRGVFHSYLFWEVEKSLMYLILAMISFVPVIVVIRRASISSAFDSCIELWARHAKNAAMFLAVGGLLLVIPYMLEGRLFYLFPSQWSWESYTAPFLLSIYKVSAGVLIMCSMVAFCRKLHEAEEESGPPPTPES
jgi:hypothetical protein